MSHAAVALIIRRFRQAPNLEHASVRAPRAVSPAFCARQGSLTHGSVRTWYNYRPSYVELVE